MRFRRRRAAALRSAVLVPLPAAGEALEAAGLPAAGIGAPQGTPPHITVLFPFLDPGPALDEAHRDLGDMAAATPAFEVALRATGRFPGVLYLLPDRSAPFVELTRAVAARWPDHPPYGGAYNAIIPHLTVCAGEEPADFEQRIEAMLPVHDRAQELWLMAERRDGRWERAAAFALGAGG